MINTEEEKEINEALASDVGNAPTPLEAEEQNQEEQAEEALSGEIAKDEDALEEAKREGASSEELHTLKKKAVNATLWNILEVGTKHFVSLGISIIIARLVLPESFGAVAMLSIFMSIAGTFIDSGMGTALLRKTDRTDIDCCTVFYFNFAVSGLFCIILCLCAPLIADFYNMPILTPMTRVLALSLIIGPFAIVQRTLFTADLAFKVLTKFNIFSQILSGLIGIVLAYLDFQVWALLAQSISSTLINTIVVWFKSSWRPKWLFSWKSFRELFGFGSKMLASGLLNTIFTNLYGVVIGKVYTASDLAYYNRATSLTNITSMVPTSVLGSVTFPVLCKLQHDQDALRQGYRRILRLSAFVVFPICLGLGGVAYPLINVLYTKTWIFTAGLLQIIVFSFMWYPIHSINLNYLMVAGRSDLFFKLEVIKKIQTIIILCVTVPFGIKAMCWGSVIAQPIGLFINCYYTGKFLNLSLWKQLNDIKLTFLLSVSMFIGIHFLAKILGDGIISLIVCIATGVIFYAGSALLLRMPEVGELKRLKK